MKPSSIVSKKAGENLDKTSGVRISEFFRYNSGLTNTGSYYYPRGSTQFCIVLLYSSSYVSNTLEAASCYPIDNSNHLLVISESKLILISQNDEKELEKVWEFNEIGAQLSSHAAWLDSTRVYLGDRLGRLTVFDLEQRKIESMFFIANGDKSKVRQIVKTSNGVCCLIGTNKIVVYDELNEFKLKHVAVLPLSQSQRQNNNHSNVEEGEIVRIGINKSEKLLVCITTQNCIYKLDLAALSSRSKPTQTLSLECVHSFHSSRPHSVDTCQLKPIVLTSDDYSVRLWNYAERRMELCKRFVDKIYSASLHPYGLHLALAFFDRIQFYSIVDGGGELCLTRTFRLTECGCCKCVKFSSGGGLIGAIECAVIRCYQVWGYADQSSAQDVEINVNVGRFEWFDWIDNDQRIVACTSAGLVGVWSRLSGNRLWEYVDKRTQFVFVSGETMSIAALDRNGNVYLLAMKNLISTSHEQLQQQQQTPVADLELVRLITPNNTTMLDKISSICMNSYCCCRYLIVGTEKGQVGGGLLYDTNNDDEELLSFRRRWASSSICQLQVSSNKVLISASRDGLITIARRRQQQQQQQLLLKNFNLVNNDDKNEQEQQTEAEESNCSTSSWWSSDICLESRHTLGKLEAELDALKKRKLNEANEKNYEIDLDRMLAERRLKWAKDEARLVMDSMRTRVEGFFSLVRDVQDKYAYFLDGLDRKAEKGLEFIEKQGEEALTNEYKYTNELASTLDRLQTETKFAQDEFRERKVRQDEIERNLCALKLEDFRYLLDIELKSRNKVIDQNRLNIDTYECNFEALKRRLIRRNEEALSEIAKEAESMRIEKNLIRLKLTSMRNKVRRLRENEAKLVDMINASRHKYNAKATHVEALQKAMGVDETMSALLAHKRVEKRKFEAKLKGADEERKLIQMSIQDLEERSEREEAKVGLLRQRFREKENVLLALVEKVEGGKNRVHL